MSRAGGMARPKEKEMPRRRMRRRGNAKNWRHGYGSKTTPIILNQATPKFYELYRIEGQANKKRFLKQLEALITIFPTGTASQYDFSGHLYWAYGKLQNPITIEQLADPDNPERAWAPRGITAIYVKDTALIGSTHRMRWPKIGLTEDDVLMLGLRIDQQSNAGINAKFNFIVNMHCMYTERLLTDVTQL